MPEKVTFETSPELIEPITKREREVLVFVAKGYENIQIAEALSLSVYTVMSHRRNIRFKLKITNAAEAAMIAIKSGLVQIA